MTDFTDYTDEDLVNLRVEIQTEQERRYTVASAAEQADSLSRRYLDAVGREDGTDWVQPAGAHDAYPEGSLVLHDGKEWASLIPANVWEPGVSGWRENVEEGSGPADWVQPTGGHDAYKKGDRVSFEGSVYESLIDENTWSPTEYPAGWSEITA